jgi:hypothetical protein
MKLDVDPHRLVASSAAAVSVGASISGIVIDRLIIVG